MLTLVLGSPKLGGRTTVCLPEDVSTTGACIFSDLFVGALPFPVKMCTPNVCLIVKVSDPCGQDCEHMILAHFLNVGLMGSQFWKAFTIGVSRAMLTGALVSRDLFQNTQPAPYLQSIFERLPPARRWGRPYLIISFRVLTFPVTILLSLIEELSTLFYNWLLCCSQNCIVQPQ